MSTCPTDGWTRAHAALGVALALAMFTIALGDAPTDFPTLGRPYLSEPDGLADWPAPPMHLSAHVSQEHTASWSQPLYEDPMVQLAQSVSQLDPPSDPNTDGAGSGAINDAETLGSQPEDQPLRFLRSQTVLLSQGEWQLDVGMTYAVDEADTAVALVNPRETVIGVDEANLTQRLLLVPLQVRYGLTPRVQLFMTAPLGYAETELAVGGTELKRGAGGIGDLGIGTSIQIIPGSVCRPELIGTVGLSAPTGNASLATSLLTPEASLGQGFWDAYGSLLWVRTYDPLIIFYGGGASFRFERELDGILVNPGERLFYQLGVGFAVNQRVTLSSSFLGAYWFEDYLDGVPVAGGVREPMRMRFAATIGKSCRIIEPFAEVGMTDDAVNSRVGIVWTY